MPNRTAALDLFCPADRADWHTWLERNHATSPGVWLVLLRKHASGPGIGYDEAVEEALCFGWIDSRMNPLGADRWKQLFTPRRPGGTWSKSNRERVERLTQAGLMAPAGLATVETAQRDGSWTKLNRVEDVTVPDDLREALAANAAAERNFLAFSRSSRQMILWWIVDAKRPQTRAKRIAETVRCAAANRRVMLDRE